MQPVQRYPSLPGPESNMSLKFGIVVFPGSNCDHDAYHAIKHVLGEEAQFIWHKEASIGESDVIVVIGLFVGR